MTQKIAALQRLRGLGTNFAAVLMREVLCRSFANRRQLELCRHRACALPERRHGP